MKITEDNIQKIIRLRKKKHTLSRIASELLITKCTVQYWLNKNKQGKTIKICKFCSKSFEIIGKNKQQKYCNGGCYTKYWNKFRHNKAQSKKKKS